MAKVTQRSFLLDESRIPKSWYNVAADLPSQPDPPIHPATGQPLGPDDLAPLFPMGLIMQEVSTEREIEIPDPVRDIYKLWRPTPLYYAARLKAALDTPAHIFYKYEGVSPPGSHKPNTAVAQAFYNQQEGVRRITTETGAGQWGSSLAFACNLYDIECKVYMVKVSYQQKPGRRVMMETYRASVVPSPSDQTEPGRTILAQDPDSPGSLGIAISEAVWEAGADPNTKYSLGSVLNHVLLHQTVVGQEMREQMEMAGFYPDTLIGCVGGGSNFAGFSFPFIADKLKGERSPRIIAVEPTACPTFTKGLYTYDYGDSAGLTPLLKMHTLGSSFVPAPIHSGGLRYHGMAPMLCHLYNLGLFEARAYPQLPVFEAAVTFAQAEGIIPAPEPAHAVRAVIDEALAAREAGEERVIVFNLCGHGHFDLTAYEAYLGGRLENYEYPEEKIHEAIARLPQVPGR